MSDAGIKKVPGLPFLVSPDGDVYNMKGRPYKKVKSNVGYYRVLTRIKGKSSTFLVHRLVARAFIDNPHNYPCVNHKDENPLNNRVDNLEWCTRKYNANYGTKIERQVLHQLNRPDQSKKVIRLHGAQEVEYPSAKQAQRDLKINNANIIACCKGKRKTAGGYGWRYAI